MTAKRVAEQNGTRNLTLLFADVGGAHSSPHVGEDEDTYRFIEEAAANVGGELVIVNEGRDIWEVFKDDRFLGNSRLANCSKFLKQRPCRKWLEDNCDPADTVVYVGIDWSESHRLPAIVNAYKPYRAEAPLTQPPFFDREDLFAACEAEGIEVPRLYKLGANHNNCGGFCVRAGQAHFEWLLRTNPERYRFHEGKEQELREHLGKDVTILKRTESGVPTPVTMRQFREELEVQPSLFDSTDFGGCGCFVDGAA
ncbi:hypothetical protein [Rhodococcus sp. 5G237]